MADDKRPRPRQPKMRLPRRRTVSPTAHSRPSCPLHTVAVVGVSRPPRAVWSCRHRRTRLATARNVRGPRRPSHRRSPRESRWPRPPRPEPARRRCPPAFRAVPHPGGAAQRAGRRLPGHGSLFRDALAGPAGRQRPGGDHVLVFGVPQQPPFAVRSPAAQHLSRDHRSDGQRQHGSAHGAARDEPRHRCCHVIEWFSDSA